jgi:FtsZ-interacting cell division protein ZipA
MRFDTKAEAPKLFFQPMRWLSDDEYETVMEQATSKDAIRAVSSTVASVDGVKAAPLALAGKAPTKPVIVEEDEEEVVAAPPPKAKAKAKTAPAPVVEEDEAEPEVRKAEVKVSSVPAKKGSLASIVADWDDE